MPKGDGLHAFNYLQLPGVPAAACASGASDATAEAATQTMFQRDVRDRVSANTPWRRGMLSLGVRVEPAPGGFSFLMGPYRASRATRRFVLPGPDGARTLYLDYKHVTPQFFETLGATPPAADIRLPGLHETPIPFLYLPAGRSQTDG